MLNWLKRMFRKKELPPFFVDGVWTGIDNGGASWLISERKRRKLV